VLPVLPMAWLGAVVLALARTQPWSELLVWEQHFDFAAMTLDVPCGVNWVPFLVPEGGLSLPEWGRVTGR